MFKNTINSIASRQRRLDLNLSGIIELVKEDLIIWKFSESLKGEMDNKDADDNSLVEKRAVNNGKAKQKTGKPEIDKE